MANITNKWNTNKLDAIELYAHNPMMTHKTMGDKVGVSSKTICLWMAQPDFIDECYKRYMEVAGIELPSVIMAMMEEAKRGNVQAGRLILEHFGKLENRIKIQVESPFEKFMRMDAEEAEFVDMSEEEIDVISKVTEVLDINKVKLPQRDESNDEPKTRSQREKERLNLSVKMAYKEDQKKKQLREAYYIRKRAKAVGLEPLKGGRAIESKRDAWLKELESLEIKKFGAIQ